MGGPGQRLRMTSANRSPPAIVSKSLGSQSQGHSPLLGPAFQPHRTRTHSGTGTRASGPSEPEAKPDKSRLCGRGREAAPKPTAGSPEAGMGKLA